MLRVFDNTYEFGPCVGMTRLERWERAQALGLNPPPEVGCLFICIHFNTSYDLFSSSQVREILLTEQGQTDAEIAHSVFYGRVLWLDMSVLCCEFMLFHLLSLLSVCQFQSTCAFTSFFSSLVLHVVTTKLWCCPIIIVNLLPHIICGGNHTHLDYLIYNWVKIQGAQLGASPPTLTADVLRLNLVNLTRQSPALGWRYIIPLHACLLKITKYRPTSFLGWQILDTLSLDEFASESSALRWLWRFAIVKWGHFPIKVRRCKELERIINWYEVKTNLLISTSTVSRLWFLFQLAKTGSLVGSTLPSTWFTKGKLTRETNWRVGGRSG